MRIGRIQKTVDNINQKLRKHVILVTQVLHNPKATDDDLLDASKSLRRVTCASNGLIELAWNSNVRLKYVNGQLVGDGIQGRVA